MSTFSFLLPEASPQSGLFVMTIPPNIASADQLFSAIQTAGEFPAYCGNNWDAIEEMVRNFEWVSEREIYIVHSDVPLRTETADLYIYLDILRGAMQLWSQDAGLPPPDHVLNVFFPPSEKDFVLEACEADRGS